MFELAVAIATICMLAGAVIFIVFAWVETIFFFILTAIEEFVSWKKNG